MKLTDGDVAERLERIQQFDLADRARLGQLNAPAARDELKHRLIDLFGRSHDGDEKATIARLLRDLRLFKELK